MPQTRAPITIDMVGTQSRAEQAADGTWTIYDVPIFAAHRDVRRGEGVEYSRDYLDRVIRHHKARFDRERYLAPVHVSHHGAETAKVGHLLPTRVEQRDYEGEPLDFLLADLCLIPDDQFRALKRLACPYPSVEISPTHPEIFSLALLQDEAPFFRQMLSIGQSTPYRPTAAAAPAVGYRALAQGRRAILFSFGGRTVDVDQDKMDPEKKAAEASGQGVDAIVQAVTQAIAQGMQALIAKIDEKLGGAPQPSDGPTTGPAEMDAYGRVAKKSAEPQTTAYAAGAHQALADELGEMRKRFAALEAERATAKAIDEAEAKLRAKGITADRARLSQYAAKGAAYLTGYVDAAVTHHVATPPTWTGELPAPVKDAAEVTKYAAQGPEQLKRARELQRQYEAGPASVRRSVSLESFIRGNLDEATLAGKAV